MKSPHHSLILICGTPATGKTTFGNWLHDTHGFLHLDLESRDCLHDNGLPLFWPHRIWNLDSEGVTVFMQYLHTTFSNVVLTWAFHTDLIPFVRHLCIHDVSAWWFEGDRLAGRLKYSERCRIMRDGVAQVGLPDSRQYDRYVATIVEHWEQIAPIFGDNIIHTLHADGTYVLPETIFRHVTACRHSQAANDK